MVIINLSFIPSKFFAEGLTVKRTCHVKLVFQPSKCCSSLPDTKMDRKDQLFVINEVILDLTSASLFSFLTFQVDVQEKTATKFEGTHTSCRSCVT